MSDTKEKSCREFFGERLKQLRTESGLSQDALAKKLGISKGSLGFYETCKNTPDIEFLNAVSNYFKVSPDYLLGYTENQTNDTNLQAVCDFTGLSDKAIKSLLLTNKLNNKQLHSTIEFILEDLFEEIEECLEHEKQSKKSTDFITFRAEGSRLLSRLMCYFSVRLPKNTSHIESYLLVSPDCHFIDEHAILTGTNPYDFTNLILADKELVAEKIYYDNVCSALKRAKKLYLEKKDGERDG